jgi:hypothetical protein
VTFRSALKSFLDRRGASFNREVPASALESSKVRTQASAGHGSKLRCTLRNKENMVPGRGLELERFI